MGWKDAPAAGGPAWMAAPVAAQRQASQARVPQRTSQALGFAQGAFKPLDNAAIALETGLRRIAPGATQFLDETFGGSAQDAVNARAQAIQSSGLRPGKIGEFAGNVVGTLPLAMLPGGVLAQGAAGGALLTDKRDVKGVLTDAAIGAAGGAAGYGVAKGLGYAGGKALGAITTRSAAPAKANDYLVRVARAAGVNTSDLMAASPDITAAEALGQTGMAQLGALARRPGLTGESLTGKISERRIARPEILQEEFGNAIGIHPAAAAGNIRSLVEKGRKEAAPLYADYYASDPFITPKLESLMSRPSMKKALAKGADIAAEEGENPIALGFAASPASGDIPEMITVRTPTPKLWDYVKRGLDDVLDESRDKTTGKLVLDTKGRATQETLKEFRGELVTAQPKYGQALAKAGDYLGAQDAFEKGQKLVFNPKTTAYEFGKTFKALTPANQQAFKGGIANQVFDLVQTGKLKPETLKTPLIRNKLASVLGKPETDALIASAEQQAKMAAFETRYGAGGNSITHEMMVADQFLEEGTDGVGNVARGVVQFAGNPKGSLMNLAAQKLQSGIDMARNPKLLETRNLAGEALMGSPQALAQTLRSGLPQAPAKRVFSKSELDLIKKASDRLARPYGMFGSTMALQNQGQR
jgi:hypothetical protein